MSSERSLAKSTFSVGPGGVSREREEGGGGRGGGTGVGYLFLVLLEDHCASEVLDATSYKLVSQILSPGSHHYQTGRAEHTSLQ